MWFSMKSSEKSCKNRAGSFKENVDAPESIFSLQQIDGQQSYLHNWDSGGKIRIFECQT